MTRPDLIQRLRATSARCRIHADAASDPEAAQALRAVADEMEAVISVLGQTVASQQSRGTALGSAKVED